MENEFKFYIFSETSLSFLKKFQPADLSAVDLISRDFLSSTTILTINLFPLYINFSSLFPFSLIILNLNF